MSDRASSAAEAVAVLLEAARLNREDPCLDGAMLRLPRYGQAVMTGDLHGHQRNFDKLRRYAGLETAAGRHVILHELIHRWDRPGEPDDSHRLLLDAARYKCDFPDQVHFLQSNHELAQLTGYGIVKESRDVTEAFHAAVLTAFGLAGGEEVLDAIDAFIESLPLAAVTSNRVWMSHSLPDAARMDEFDFSIFDRPPSPKALRDRDGGVFRLVWGRRHTAEQLELWGRRFNADLFLLGHQSQEMGHAVRFGRLILLASEHNHGTFLPFDLARPLTLEALEANIRKFVAVE